MPQFNFGCPFRAFPDFCNPTFTSTENKKDTLKISERVELRFGCLEDEPEKWLPLELDSLSDEFNLFHSS